MIRIRRSLHLLAVSVLFASGPLQSARAWPPPPTPLPGLEYNAEFFPGSRHDPAIPTPDSILGFRLGDRPVMHAQVEAVIKALAAKSPRCRLFEYGRTHEGRVLYYLAISSEANIRNLDTIKANAARLADPRAISTADADRLIETMPAIAWMSYVIHGDEMSGTDAALALTWHLAASTDEAQQQQLNDLVVLIDPLMNPDGRDRSITQIHQNRISTPSVDDQSIIHAQTWPSGRMNHYLFDLNRDWIFGSQPETRGRLAAVGSWNPHYFMESHEQGSQDTFLFMPARAPINPNISRHIREWQRRFASDQGKAFDAQGWRYYTGEWNEGWYPGYSGSWGALRGAVDNLYEQANIQIDGVRRAEGTIESYREAVHKQLVSSQANLQTLQKNRKDVITGFVADRRENISADGPLANRTFMVPINAASRQRVRGLFELLRLQGIECSILKGEDPTFSGRDWLGRPFKDRSWTGKDQAFLMVSARQPLGRLTNVLMTLDPRMEPSFLADERRELLRLGQSKLYDITGWNLAMLAGLEIFEIDAPMPAAASVISKDEDLGMIEKPIAPAPDGGSPAAVAFAADGHDDRSLPLAARLMERGVQVRVLDKPTELDGSPLARGSLLVTRKDNTEFGGNLEQTIRGAAGELGVTIRSIGSGMGPGDNPDLGGQHFVLLSQPRIAVFTRDPFNPYTAGEIWHLIDHEMGIRASYINSEMVGATDLRRYNVIVLPDGGASIAEKMIETLRPWVESGGTLISIGSSCSAFAKDKSGIGSTRLLPDVLTKREDYRVAIIRDWLGRTETIDPAVAWSHTAPVKIEYPWAIEGDAPSEDEAKRRDAWRAIFMPQGALLAARIDDRSWLTAGCGEVLPVVYGNAPVLIPSSGMNAPVLMGQIVTAPPPPPPPAPADGAAEKKADDVAAEKTTAASEKKDGEKKDADKKDGDKEDKKSEPKPGWTIAPPGHELRLRMSGLLWPEAADRIAHSAYVTREGIGAGQIILFSNSPTFRDATPGTKRLFANAIICGPGMGASQAIRP